MAIFNDIKNITNQESIKEHLTNLFHLNKFDKKFHPEIYIGINELLFENWTVQHDKIVEDRIKTGIAQWEPRIKLNTVQSDSSKTNTIEIYINYTIININVIDELTLSFRRVR